MNLVSLDTNLLVRLIIKDVPEHVVAAATLISSQRCYVTDVVVTEAVFALERIYGLERPEITAALLYVFRSFQLNYNATVINAAFEEYGQRSALSFVDCYAAMEAKIRGCKLATFDKKLVKGNPHVLEPR